MKEKDLWFSDTAFSMKIHAGGKLALQSSAAETRSKKAAHPLWQPLVNACDATT